jgi:hypothetical protein
MRVLGRNAMDDEVDLFAEVRGTRALHGQELKERYDFYGPAEPGIGNLVCERVFRNCVAAHNCVAMWVPYWRCWSVLGSTCVAKRTDDASRERDR